MDKSTLRRAVKGVSGTAFISIDTITDVHLSGGKSNPYFGHVTKHVTHMQVMVFNNPAWARLVQRRLTAEGIKTKFVPSPRAWGTRVEGEPLVEHEGKLYLEVIVLRPGNVEYRWKGMPVLAETIVGLPAERPNDYNIVIRVFNSESIKKLTINGRSFT